MPDQEFLASFAVEIDEAGVFRLQRVLAEDRDLADELAASFSAASEAIERFAEDLSLTLPSLYGGEGHGVTTETGFGTAGLRVGLDLTEAEEQLSSFLKLAQKPLSLSANASGMVSAARTALANIRSLFSDPLVIQAKVESSGDPGGGGGGGDTVMRMSSGGRFTKPTDVQVAEDGDAEYIIPVKKEDRAVPLLRQLLSELSPGARESLSPGEGIMPLSGGVMAGAATAAQVIQNHSNVSAPVHIDVHASGGNGEQIGKTVYDTAERYLLRTLEGVFA